MIRTTFETNRALEFFTEKELAMQIGAARESWPVTIIKELVDNALDACEMAGVTPEIAVEVTDEYISVADNGPGLPEETLRKSLNYLIRVSDKNHYASPSRGQLGNALKCVWAAPFVLEGESLIEVFTPGKRAVVAVKVDAIAQEPVIEISVEESEFVKNGSFLKIWSKNLSSLINDDSRFLYKLSPKQELEKLIKGYGLFNPAARFELTLLDGKISVPPTADGVVKWLPTMPTSPWWYDDGRIKNLICAYLADEARGGRPRTLREFVSEFVGLKGSGKQKAALAPLAMTGKYLKDLVNGDDGLRDGAAQALLESMKEHSRPVRPAELGVIGEEAFVGLDHRFGHRV